MHGVQNIRILSIASGNNREAAEASAAVAADMVSIFH